MDYICKMPFIMGASAAIIVGMTSYSSGYEFKSICIRMSAGMVLFFVVGVYLRRLINSLYTEVKEKKENDDRNTAEIPKQDNNEHDKNHGIDYRVGDDAANGEFNAKHENDKLYDEEFEPLEVSRVTIKDDKQ